MQRTERRRGGFDLSLLYKVFGAILFVYLFLGFMVLPCLNTLTSIFTTKDAAANVDPLAVIRFFFAGNMPSFVINSLKLAVCLVVTVNVVGISIVLLTEYFDIKGAKILRLGYMTTLIYSGVALVTGYQFLYDSNGMLTQWLAGMFPGMNRQWFSGFSAVLFTMTFACTSNHALFLRNAIRGIDYNTVEAARNLGAKPFKVLLKVVMPTLLPTLFSLTVMTFITGLCAMSAPTLLGYNSINPEIVRLAGSSVADEAFPQARAALLSIILALFTIVLLTVLNHYERKGHYLSVSKTKAKLVKQKIQNPVWNVLAHIYAYVLFVIYMTPVVMIVLFAFQNWPAVRAKSLNVSDWTLINFFGTQDYSYTTSRGKQRVREGVISGVFSNADTVGGIRLSFVLSALAAALACVIVVVAVNYIFKHRNKKRAVHRGGLPAVPVAAAHDPDLLLLPHLLQRRGVVRAGQEPVLPGERALFDRDGLHGGQAALRAAHGEGRLLRHRRRAGGRRPEPGGQLAGHVPAGEAAHRAAQRAGGVRAELQRAVHRVRHVRHLPLQLRQELRHGHPVHDRGGGPRRLQHERLRPALRLHGVHHAGVRPDPVPGLRRRRPGPGRAPGAPQEAQGVFCQDHGKKG